MQIVIVDVICSLRCPVNYFIDVCFIIVVNRENDFCCNTMSGHKGKLSASLNSGATSSSLNKSTVNIHKYAVLFFNNAE